MFQPKRTYLETYVGTEHGEMYLLVSRKRRGSSTDIVLIHGLIVSSSYMEPTAAQLSRYHRTLVPDLIGHGKSTSTEEAMTIVEHAEALSEALTKLGVRNPVFVGGSYGCHVALELALNKKLKPSGLVLVGPADVRCGSTSIAISNVLADGLYEPPQMVPMVLADIVRIGVTRCVELLKDMSEHPFFDRLKELKVPALFIRGEHDKLISDEFMTEALLALPTAEVITVESGAHCLTVSEPELISQIICDFAARKRRASAA